MKSGYPDYPKFGFTQTICQPKIDAPNPNCLMNTIPEPFSMVWLKNYKVFSKKVKVQLGYKGPNNVYQF